MSKRIYLFLFVVLAFLSIPTKANNPFIQTQLDALFIINAAENTTTALYTIGYIQDATMEDVRWLFPIPENTFHMELVPNIAHELLNRQTEAEIEAPHKSDICTLTPVLTWGHGFTPYTDYLPPEEGTIIPFADSASAWEWFAESGIAVSESSRAYPQMVGVNTRPQQAVEVNVPLNDSHYWNGFAVNTSATLLIQYEGTEPFLPIGFHAENTGVYLPNYEQTGAMNINVYIVADQAYTAENWDPIIVDLSDLRDPMPEVGFILRNFDGTGTFFNALDPIYYNRLWQALNTVNGQGFNTEYVGPIPPSSASVIEPTDSSRLFDDLTAGYSTVTRFRTFLQSGIDAPDPRFIPIAQNIAPFRYRLENFVDPALYYGCTTRAIQDSALESRLPEGRTYLPALGVYVAHPENWLLSEITPPFETDAPLFALSPEPVTYTALHAREYGQDGPPIFVFQAFTQPPINNAEGFTDAFYPNNVWDFFTSTNDFHSPTSVNARNAFRLFYPSTTPKSLEAPPVAEGVRMAIISTFADFAANQALYEDMLHYVNTRQFWLSSQFRHTLFVGEGDKLLQIAYPEGWIERFNENTQHHGSLVPTGDNTTEAHIRVVNLSYNPELLAPYENAMDGETAGHQTFTLEGRRGYVLWDETYLVEVSVKSEFFAENQALLQALIEAVKMPHKVIPLG